MNSSTMTTSQRPRFSLRISLLRRLLACSPKLARPLKDATMEQMRRASEQQLPDCLFSASANRQKLGNSPSVEALMTLCWAIHVIEKELRLENTPKLGADMEEGQAVELTFRPTIEIREREEFPFVKHGRRGSMGSGSGRSKKTLGDWRPVFDHPHGR
jgi:transcriptional activator HAC1